MNDLPSPVRSYDDEHLKLLALFHYIVGGLGALAACFPLIHVALGVAMVTHPSMMSGQQGNPPPAFVGYLFAGLGLFFCLLGWSAAIATIISGRMMARRKRRMFSFVVGAILCVFFPFGTVLGVFTIIVLSRDSVRRLYGELA